MFSRTRRLLKWPGYAVLALMLLLSRHDSLHLNPAEEAAVPYMFDLLEWEATNFFSKWTHRLTRSLPWNTLSQHERQGQIKEFFNLGEELLIILRELDRISANNDLGNTAKARDLQDKAKLITSRRDQLRNDVEETIEAAISAVISGQGLGLWGDLILPPVDIRLAVPPKVLVTSPRDQIRREYDVLLRPDIRASQSEAMEARLLHKSDLAALVISIGGLATYPASLPNNQSLQWTLQISAHEWLHHYYYFRSFGQKMFQTEEMQILNESVADIAGREIGNMAQVILEGPTQFSDFTNVGVNQGQGTMTGIALTDFDFDFEMHATRMAVDELLAEGMIDQAETYMEERRRLFVANGFFIRKLNQAYFAFNGTYASNAASVSPIGNHLRRFRSLLPDVGTFVQEMSSISTYEEFLEALADLESGAKIP